MNLFAYGTLMCPDILADVAMPGLEAIPGTLHGYKRWAVRGEEYPAIRRHPSGRVQGILYRDLPNHAWPRLDRFEGEMYRRATLTIRHADGETLAAETYVLHEKFAHCLDTREWDFEAFLRHGKGRFKRLYRGYSNLE